MTAREPKLQQFRKGRAYALRYMESDSPTSFMIARDTQLFMAERMKARVRRCLADHTPIVTAPSAVVDTILDAGRESGGY